MIRDTLPPGQGTTGSASGVVLLLASASPRRRRLLELWDIPHRAMEPGAQEVDTGAPPERLVIENARRKVLSLRTTARGLAPEAALQWCVDEDTGAPPHANEPRPSEGHLRILILGVDTLVVHDGHVMGKPRDRREALAMMSRLSGMTHRVLSGLYLAWHDDLHRGIEALEETRVTFRNLSEDERRWYVDTGEGADKAGGYGIQGRGGVLVDRIDGCYFNVVGCPAGALVRALEAQGVSLARLRTDAVRRREDPGRKVRTRSCADPEGGNRP